ncbi:Nucleolar protein 58 [Coccomyxa sp. Obi]|nr:Nucleolar protein 58 [Coccomyxa sp. Obi]
MLLLFETAAGFALFKVLKENKIQETEDLWQDFETLEGAQKIVKLKAFSKFESTIEALASATALGDSKLSKDLKKFLKKNADGNTLGVVDAKLGSIIKEKLGIPCIYSNGVQELTRGVRSQIEGLISGLAGGQDLTPMSLGLSHSLSRYKLKFSPDKVDTMIVQAIGLLDDLDKELNTYAMRVREWYGWHFPEMTKIVTDNIVYAKVIKLMGTRENAVDKDFSGIPLEEEVEEELKETAIISMGTEISPVDLLNIMSLCDQVIALAEYRAQLYDYLKSRMMAIAPNLTVLVGELVGARLIAHAGSLVNLAKQPASTVQILGAEKALFRALKTKHETPKYGLIFHASLIGQAPPKYKGKISRVLAAKCALSIRVDALGDVTDGQVGLESRAKVEARLRQLEGKLLASDSAKPRAGKGDIPKYDAARQGNAGPALITAAKAYNPDADVTADAGKEEKKKKKKKKVVEEAEATEAPNGVAEAGPSEAAPAATNGEQETGEKKKKKKRSAEEATAGAADTEQAAEPVKKKKKKDTAAVNGEVEPTTEKKKKKKAKVESA